MYLYKVYLHCQECLGTKRLQLLAATRALCGPGSKMAAKRPPEMSPAGPPRQGQRPAWLPRQGPKPVSRAHLSQTWLPNTPFPQKAESCSLKFSFESCLQNSKAVWTFCDFASGDRGPLWNSIHLNIAVTHMPTKLAANERNSFNFAGGGGGWGGEVQWENSQPYGNTLQKGLSKANIFPIGNGTILKETKS